MRATGPALVVALALSGCRSPGAHRTVAAVPRRSTPFVPLVIRRWADTGMEEAPLAPGERVPEVERAVSFVAPAAQRVTEAELPVLVDEIRASGATGVSIPATLEVDVPRFLAALAPLAIRALDVSERRISDADLKALRSLTSLRVLRAEGARFTDRVELAPLGQLERLVLNRASISDERLGVLPPTLMALELADTALSDISLAERLPALTRLHALMLARSRAGNGAVRAVRGATGLELLDVSGTQVSDALAPVIQTLTALRTVLVDRAEVGDPLIAALDGASGLQLLSANETRISDAALRHLAGHRRLRALGVSGTRVTARGLRALRTLTELRELAVDVTGADDQSIAALFGATHLSLLSAEQTRVDDALLLPFPELRSLRLAATRVGDRVASQVSRLSQLTDLSLSATEVSRAGVAVLGAVRTLEALDVSELVVDDATLGALSGLTGLRTLSLAGTQVSADGLARLADARQLVALDLSGTAVDDHLFSVLGRGSALRKLQLARTRVRTLAGLRGLRHLEELGVEEDALAPEALAEIGSLPALRALDAASTEIGDPEAGALQTSAALRWLNLSDTLVSDQGVAMLPSGIRELFLAGTRLTDASAEGLSRRGLESLDVRRIGLSDAAVEQLAAHVTRLKH